MIKKNNKIGISMRVITEKNYNETRDALAHDWYHFLAWALGDGVCWIPIPNLGEKETKIFIQQHQLTGIILSGGNDIGEYSIRDETETSLIEYAMTHHLPIIGVCRGLQMLWKYFGGQIKAVDVKKHVANRHKLKITRSIVDILKTGLEIEVNSFHANGLVDMELSASIEPFAYTDDGEIEGIICSEMRLIGIMWHPEREQAFSNLDKQLFRWALLGESS